MSFGKGGDGCRPDSDRALLVCVDSSQTTRAAVAGVGMAFLSLVLFYLGRDLFGWTGAIIALLAILLIARALQPAIVRWIRGTQKS
jgi:hypothetical protein